LGVEDRKVQQFFDNLAQEVVDRFQEVDNNLRKTTTIDLQSLMIDDHMWEWVGSDRGRLITLQRAVIARVIRRGYPIRPSPEDGKVTWS
jgi:hypothetical protein